MYCRSHGLSSGIQDSWKANGSALGTVPGIPGWPCLGWPLHLCPSPTATCSLPDFLGTCFKHSELLLKSCKGQTPLEVSLHLCSWDALPGQLCQVRSGARVCHCPVAPGSKRPEHVFATACLLVHLSALQMGWRHGLWLSVECRVSVGVSCQEP